MRHAMKTIAELLTALLVAVLGCPSMGRAAELKVVATTTDLAAVARAVGGDDVDVTALARPTEDPHFVDAKPSFIRIVNQADVLIEGGASLEAGWLPPILDSARNARISLGSAGRVVAAQGIPLLEVPTQLDRSMGDVHPQGNPHFMLDPVAAKTVAQSITTSFCAVDNARCADYQAGLDRFRTAIDAKLRDWQATLAPFKGAKVVTYHKDFPYFAERFGLDIVENLEPKPGIAPSPAHLAKVIETMKATQAHVILVQPFQNRKTAETVARQTDGVVVDTPQQPGAQGNARTYFDVINNMVSTLATAFARK